MEKINKVAKKAKARPTVGGTYVYAQIHSHTYIYELMLTSVCFLDIPTG